jgi:histidine triad (HIT) family protein
MEIKKQTDNNCIFCKIVDGKLPSKKIYEDEKTLAFLTNEHDVYGHMLVIPKSHSKNFIDAKFDDLKACINTIQKIGLHLEKLGYQFNEIVNNGENAGQEVFHLHFHIIPRDKNYKGIYENHLKNNKTTRDFDKEHETFKMQ